MAQRRRTTSRTTTARRSRSGAHRRGGALPLPRISLGLSPAVARSLVGIVLLVIGAVTLIALALPGQGALTDWWRNLAVPFFGAGRWLLPFVLLLAGWYLEWGPGHDPGAAWGRTLLGIGLTYAGFLGILQIIAFSGEYSGGRIGRFLAGLLDPALTTPGAFVILLGASLAGLLIAFDLPLRTILAPMVDAGRSAAASLQDRAPRATSTSRPGTRAADARSSADARGASTTPAPPAAGTEGGRRGRAGRIPAVDAPGQTGMWGTDAPASATGGTASPTSATFAPARPNGAPSATPTGGELRATREARPVERDPEDVTDASDSPPKQDIEWRLPPHDLLEAGEALAPTANQDAVHAWNEDRIIEKLASFDIEARIIGRNAGPVVTQYEVQPAAHIKLSRIEALSDDLSMALAARSIRIEAPIPGKAAVGIEIPNREFNVVALRRILDEVDFPASGSRLTFALGRDVAGRAQAVDLSKMPHLLIAGATGSGKSVMVNALITSLLCNATPDDTRMILMDLKRVELAGYNGLPHLLVPGDHGARAGEGRAQVGGGRDGEPLSPVRRRHGPQHQGVQRDAGGSGGPPPVHRDRVDELADLMMREGKNVEDPIVRLAQKARATGIHMVLATQRPSVNVVTGLIKANFPSRIAFAMASQIDSRTILDAPGAEDLIGRGDMLYQPSDLPRPMRLQGVFVSDAEIAKVTQHWRDQIGDPHYDLSIVDSGDDSTGSVEDTPDEDADRLLPDAVGVVREYDRASASLLQRRLRIGYARAARIIDQLEARGYVGAFDGSNARVVLRRDDGPADMDEGSG